MSALVLVQSPLLGQLQCPIAQGLDIGRQQLHEPPPLNLVETGSVRRLIVASRDDTTVGRQQARLELVENNVRVSNLNTKIPLTLEGQVLPPKDSRTVRIPATLMLGALSFRITEGPEYESLGPVTRRTVQPLIDEGRFEPSLSRVLERPEGPAVMDRLERLISVLQLAATSPDFLGKVASAARELLNLDRTAIVLRKDRTWHVAATAARGNVQIAAGWRPSSTLLEHVAREKSTSWQSPKVMFQEGAPESLGNLLAVVAAPIKDAKDEVLGAIYGDRSNDIRGNPINIADARLLDVLATGVAGGLMRTEQEQAALARRVQLERFVPPEVARQLDDDPDMLSGCDAEATLLFCDIAGFSRITEKLPPGKTFEWINDVMETLSACVMAEGGTLVDYVGDELFAMWGAPIARGDHALCACRAAIAMIHSLAGLTARWSSVTGAPIEIGIGINSGPVRVGNAGSHFKFKYGPVGNNVNIASRVQGATRHLRTTVLLTGATATRVSSHFSLRRVCAVRVKNIEQPIDLFELAIDPTDEWPRLCAAYKTGLDYWDAGKLTEAIQHLSRSVAEFHGDGPSLVLLSRAIEFWSHGQFKYDPVWQFTTK